GDNHALTRAHLAPGPNQRFPCEFIGRSGLGQENLDPPSLAVLAMSIEPRRKYTGIVQDDAIARPHVRRKITKGSVFPSAAPAIHPQHPRSRAIRERLLCDQFFGEMIVEIG